MLSIANIKGSGTASHYYERDNYYIQGSKEHLALNEWYGNGADMLSLKGSVDSSTFKQILEGKLPNGTELGRKENNELVHAPGLDLTFSAPKSVSIVAEVHGDARVHIAHNTAVKRTLEYIEKNYIATRKMSDRELAPESTNNMIVAMFRHNTSRNLDPQLHTHCVLANATCRQDGVWRSGYFAKIFDNKLHIGQIYRNELAYELVKLGYEIRHAGQDSRFEIKDIPQSLIEKFSSRARDIAEAAKDFKHVNAKLKAELTLRTRERKTEVDLPTLKQMWQAKLEEHNVSQSVAGEQEVESKTVAQYINNKWQQFCEKFDLKQMAKLRPFIIDSPKLQESCNAEKALEHAINHISERQAVWEEKELISAAMSYGVGIVRHDQILATLTEYKKQGVLLEAKNTSHGLENPITSKPSLESELQIIQYITASKNSTNSVCSKVLMKEYLSDQSSLTQGQKQAIKLILTSKDRTVAVQGYAGTGKTYMLETVKLIAEKHDYRLLGIAPSASAAKTLEDSTGIASRTIHSFLFKYDGVIHDRGTAKGRAEMTGQMKNTIVVLDEASLASTKQVKALLKLAAVLDFKVVQVGDSKQLSGVEAGKPFYIAQEAGIATAIMDEPKRYTNDNLKAAVKDIINNQIGAALKKLEGNIITPPVIFDNLDAKRACLANIAAVQWLSLDDHSRSSTLITAPSNKIREMINIEIREQLKADGVLESKCVMVDTLKSKDLTHAQKLHMSNYVAGDRLLFNKSYKPLGISPQEVLTVKDIKNNILTLVNEKGANIEFDISRIAKGKVLFEVCTPHRLEVRVGEDMIWTRNFKDRPEIINSGKLKVTNINNTHISYSTGGSERFTVPLSDPAIRHIYYGYAITVHAAQGRTYQNVIGVIESEHKHLTNQKMFYVTISRAKEKAIMITDDKNILSKTLAKQKGESLSAIEHQKPYNTIKPRDLLKGTNIGTQHTVRTYPQHSTEDIYHAIYHKLSSILPEFGFRHHGSYLVSTTERKIDGSLGKKGKVYVYANNPGIMVDFTRGNISIWEYVKQNYMPAASNHEMMAYLCDMAGLSNGNYTIDKLAIDAKKALFEVTNLDHEAAPQKTERELKLLSCIQQYASNKILEGSNKALSYLKSERGYTTEQIENMGLGAIFSKKDLAHFLKTNGFTDKEIKATYKLLHQIGKSHNLLIPYKDINGNIQGFAGRNIEYQDGDKFGKYLYTKGLYKSSSLFNIDNLKASSDTHVIIVEGMLDALNASANGLRNVVALGGTSLNYKQLRLLKDCGIKQITLCLDNDKAGQEATIRIKQLVTDSKLNITLNTIDLPRTIKDPDQMIRQHGINAFEALTQTRQIQETKLPTTSIKTNIQLEAEV